MKALMQIATVAVLAAAGCAQGAQVQTAFVDVNVVPMDSDRVLRHQTVLVSGERIVEVGAAADVRIPESAARIEGNGVLYLLPGLADMHTHVSTPEDAAMYLAAGVTTVLQMGGSEMPPIKLIKDGVDSGALAAPQIFFSLKVDGPDSRYDGWPVDTPETARALVETAKARGFQFIKLYNSISPEVFEVLVEAARSRGMAVIGHGVRAVGLPEGLFKGQVMVAHAEEFLYTAFRNKVDANDVTAIAEVVRRTAESGAYVTAGLSTYQMIADQFGRPERLREYLADPRTRFMSLGARSIWLNQGYVGQQGDLRERLVFLRRITKSLADAGVPLLAGTDTPVIPGLVPGDAIHIELAELTGIGLSNFQALSAATRVPGQFIAQHVGGAMPSGVVAPGMRADLLLLRGNPLESLDELRSPLGVMGGGHWRTAAQLQALLEENAARMAIVTGRQPD